MRYFFSFLFFISLLYIEVVLSHLIAYKEKEKKTLKKKKKKNPFTTVV